MTTGPIRSTLRSHSRTCALCSSKGGRIVWGDSLCRVVLVHDPDYAGYCRVIWNSHVREMTDLPPAQRAHCMRVVFAVERALRSVLAPDKINLASFGNMAPHLHWHIIPRFTHDAHFPNPVWGKRRRSGRAGAAPPLRTGLRELLMRALGEIL